MDIPLKRSPYVQIADTAYGDDDNSPGLTSRSVKPKSRRRGGCRTVLLVLGAFVFFAIAFGAGLLTQWKARPIRSGADGQQKNSTANPDLPDLADIGNLTFIADQGTDKNAAPVSNSSTSGGFSLTEPDLAAAVSDPSKQPAIPAYADGACAFTYQHHLDPDQSPPLGDVLRPSGRVEREDAIQGYVGNCGFFAAVLALVGNGQQLDVARSLSAPGADGVLTARFKSPAQAALFANRPPMRSVKVDTVKIDGQLPRTSLEAADQIVKGCPTYVSAYPGRGDRPVLFVPLLEKAWAKYVDANADRLRSLTASDAGAVGYAGLVATHPGLVMQALTGLEYQRVGRTKPGLDVPFAGWVLACLIYARPCVFGTTDADTLDGLGTKEGPGPAITNEGGIIATNNEDTRYDIIESGTGRVLTLIGNHAYALDRENSDVLDGEKVTLENANVTIINPWARNPDFRGKYTEGGAVKMKLSTLFYVMRSVYFVKAPAD